MHKHDYTEENVCARCGRPRECCSKCGRYEAAFGFDVLGRCNRCEKENRQ